MSLYCLAGNIYKAEATRGLIYFLSANIVQQHMQTSHFSQHWLLVTEELCIPSRGDIPSNNSSQQEIMMPCTRKDAHTITHCTYIG